MQYMLADFYIPCGTYSYYDNYYKYYFILENDVVKLLMANEYDLKSWISYYSSIIFPVVEIQIC